MVHYQGSNRELLYLGTFQENIVCQMSMSSSTLQPICCLFFIVCSLFCIVCCLFCIVCCLLIYIEQKNSSSKPVVFLPLLSVVCWNTYRAKCSPSFSSDKIPTAVSSLYRRPTKKTNMSWSTQLSLKLKVQIKADRTLNQWLSQPWSSAPTSPSGASPPPPPAPHSPSPWPISSWKTWSFLNGCLEGTVEQSAQQFRTLWNDRKGKVFAVFGFVKDVHEI